MERTLSDRQELFSKQDLMRLILPLVIEQLLAVTIGMADTVMVTTVGEAAVSGISLVDSINILLINIFSALATGGAVVASQYMGRQEREEACDSAKQLLYSITLMALIIMAFALVFNKLILRGVFGNIDQDVMENAITYFWLSAVSYPFLAIYNAGAALFRSMGNSKVSMLVSLLMNIVNISGNAILIFGCQWGVAGAATASLISRALGAVIMLFLIQHKSNPIHVEHLSKIKLQWDMIKRILRVGIPTGLESGMFQIGKLMVQGLVATFGTSAIAANAIANSVASIANVPGAAIGLGMVTVVGQCVGADDYPQAIRYTKKLLLYTYVSMGALNIFLLFFAGPLVNLFNLTPGAAATAKDILFYFALFGMTTWPLSFTTPNALRAAGDARFTMIISIASMWIFRIGCSYLFALGFHMGVQGIWFGMYVDWVARAIVFTFRFLRNKWQNQRVI